MSTDPRRPDVDLAGSGAPAATQHPLAVALEAEPYRFNFFQVIYLLERWLGGDRPKLGTEGPPQRETISIKPDERMVF